MMRGQIYGQISADDWNYCFNIMNRDRQFIGFLLGIIRPIPQERTKTQEVVGRNMQQKRQSPINQSQRLFGGDSEDEEELVGVYKQQIRGQKSPVNERGISSLYAISYTLHVIDTI